MRARNDAAGAFCLLPAFAIIQACPPSARMRGRLCPLGYDPQSVPVHSERIAGQARNDRCKFCRLRSILKDGLQIPFFDVKYYSEMLNAQRVLTHYHEYRMEVLEEKAQEIMEKYTLEGDLNVE